MLRARERLHRSSPRERAETQRPPSPPLARYAYDWHAWVCVQRPAVVHGTMVRGRLEKSVRRDETRLQASLAAERAGRVLEDVVELGSDLRSEPAVGDTDRVVPLLLGADPHAAVARDALLVVAQDERVFVFRV